MPHPFHLNGEATSRGTSTARSWARHRLSSFFHGDSIITNVRKGSHTRKAGSTSERSSQRQNGQNVSGLRSPTSTRSLIDPSASPISGTRSISPATFERVRRDSQRPVAAHHRPQEEATGMARAERHLSRALSHPGHVRPLIYAKKEKRRWTCFSKVYNSEVRTRAIGSVLSGGILVILLSIYLALAISGSIQNRSWNVVLIILILIATILFCHYLIRLSILVLRVRKRKQRSRAFNGVDGDGFAQPREPIRVILVRDEELGLHENNDEDLSQARVASPPPAYGLWRSSVRADPNLIHWRRTYRGDVQNATRALILAENSINRPPSYVSEEEIRYGTDEAPNVTFPARAHF